MHENEVSLGSIIPTYPFFTVSRHGSVAGVCVYVCAVPRVCARLRGDGGRVEKLSAWAALSGSPVVALAVLARSDESRLSARKEEHTQGSAPAFHSRSTRGALVLSSLIVPVLTRG